MDWLKDLLTGTAQVITATKTKAPTKAPKVTVKSAPAPAPKAAGFLGMSGTTLALVGAGVGLVVLLVLMQKKS
jgi:hypothetical protein